APTELCLRLPHWRTGDARRRVLAHPATRVAGSPRTRCVPDRRPRVVKGDAAMMSVFLVTLPLAAPFPDNVAGEPAPRLSVRPMAAPKPALKYQLLPEVRELTPGNPVQWYMRCFAEQRYFFFHKEAVAQRARYRSTPLAELPVGELRHYGGSAL